MDAIQTIERQQGFTLLEVVIALLIFSVALVGLAGLQASAHRSNQFALEYTVATQQAHDLAERIHANSVARDQGDYNAISANSVASPIDCSNDCTPSQIAQNDIAQWQNTIQHHPSLPNPIGGATLVNGNRLLIQVLWDGRRQGGTSCDSTPPLDCVEIELEL